MSLETLNKIDASLGQMREDVKILLEKYSAEKLIEVAELLNLPEFKTLLEEMVKLEVEKQVGKPVENEPEPPVIEYPVNPFRIIHKQDFRDRDLGPTSTAQKAIDYGGRLNYDREGLENEPEIVELTDDRKWAKHYFPKGSMGGLNGVDFGVQREGLGVEFYFSYTFMHQKGFNFKISNKLPGFRMKPSIPAGQGQTPKDNGAVVYFNMDQQGRLSWNVYHHKMTQPYGERMGTPEWFFTTTPGTPVDLTMRIVLNTPGIANGILQVWINGELKSTVPNVLLRTKTSIQEFTEEVHITCMDWDYPVEQDQSMYMTDFCTWKYSSEYLAENAQVARGLKAHSKEHKLLTPVG